VVLGALLLSGQAASAAPDPPAPACTDERALSAKTAAGRLVKQRKWEAALEQFALVYGLCPSPNTTFNIATVCKEAGRLVCAWESFTRYLDEGDNPAALDRARRSLPAIEAQLLRTHGRLDLRTEPPGATVAVPGAGTRSAPTVLWLEPGRIELRLTAGGHQALQHVVELEPGERAQAVLELEKEASDGAISVESDPPGAEIECDGTVLGTAPLREQRLPLGSHVLVARAPGHLGRSVTVHITAGDTQQLRFGLTRVVEQAEASLPATPPASSWTRPAAWGALGLGAALLVAGGVLHAAAFSAAGEFDGIDTARPQAEIDSEHVDIRNRVESRQTAAWALYGGGAALALGGAALVLLAPGPADASLGLIPVLGPEGPGLCVRGEHPWF
jgi:hypothetical protein